MADDALMVNQGSSGGSLKTPCYDLPVKDSAFDFPDPKDLLKSGPTEILKENRSKPILRDVSCHPDNHRLLPLSLFP
jgi:hypothetical protein